MRIAFPMVSGVFVVNGIRDEKASMQKGRQARKCYSDRSATMKPLTILEWYHILRVKHRLKIFESIRHAIWLAS
jgi:hypothetical protein